MNISMHNVQLWSDQTSLLCFGVNVAELLLVFELLVPGCLIEAEDVVLVFLLSQGLYLPRYRNTSSTETTETQRGGEQSIETLVENA